MLTCRRLVSPATLRTLRTNPEAVAFVVRQNLEGGTRAVESVCTTPELPRRLCVSRGIWTRTANSAVRKCLNFHSRGWVRPRGRTEKTREAMSHIDARHPHSA